MAESYNNPGVNAYYEYRGLKGLLAEKTIFYGHRPITIEFCEEQINENKRVINIDTGCVYKEKMGYGKLTAIELYSKQLFLF